MSIEWQERLVAHGTSLGRSIDRNLLGVGVEFEDGCDFFWALPGEVFSTVPVPADGPVSADELIAQYDRINRVRERALHVIRHYLASLRIKVDRSPGGTWGIELEGGASTSLSVGAHLTSVARDTGDVAEAIRACLAGMWGVKVPSAKRIERYLAIAGPPAGEQSRTDETDPASTGASSTIRTALVWMGLCRALDAVDASMSPASLKAAASADGPIGQTLQLLADRFPNVEASADLLKPGTLSLEFSDGDDSFEINTKSRELASLIRKSGPAAAAEQLAAQFQSLDTARSRVRQAIDRAAAARGWRRQLFAITLFGVGPTVFLGATHREVEYSPGEKLTSLLRDGPPEAALRELFQEQAADFAEACIESLTDPGQAVPELAEASLLPKDVPPAPPLRELDGDTVAEMDRFARLELARYLQTEPAIWDYRNADLFDPKVDTWASREDWLGVAERHIDGPYPHPMAVLILLDADDPRGKNLATEYLARAEPHHEVSAAEVEIAWRFRREMPDVATRWFAPRQYEDMPYEEERAAIGDPTAIRKRAAGVTMQQEDDADTYPAAVSVLPVDEQARIHRRLLDWARTDHRWAGPQTDRLKLALEMGWRDVADALEENPFMLAGLLTTERRADQFDEPGVLLAKDFLLVWSRLSPSRFLARLLATTRSTDLLAAAEEASRRSAVGKPEVERNIGSSLEIYRRWQEDLLPALAIAWTRFRAAVD